MQLQGAARYTVYLVKRWRKAAYCSYESLHWHSKVMLTRSLVVTLILRVLRPGTIDGVSQSRMNIDKLSIVALLAAKLC